jgi:hypothetical protein
MNHRTATNHASLDTARQNHAAAELDGFIGLGMKTEAFRLARQHLKGETINPAIFTEALNAILTLADAIKPWRLLVETAYQKLSQRGKRQVRFMMLSFYCSLDDDEAAYRFIPRRFVGPIWPAELMFAIDILLALDRVEEAKPLVRKAINTVDALPNPEGRAMLTNCIASYLSETHQWEPAIHLWEGLQHDHLMAESAIFGLIELHLQRALQTIRDARQTLARLRTNPDPNLETILPGNDASRWRKAESQLDRIEQRVLRALRTAD